MDNEKIAHDLAILYLQARIHQGEIKVVSSDQDCEFLLDEYEHLKYVFTRLLREA